MNSNYMPIPSDSDNDDDNMLVPENNYDGGSERSRSTDRSHFFSQTAVDSDEDPEEDPTDNTDPRSSRPISPPLRGRARTRATARKRVPTPIMIRLRSPEPTVPTTDPYVRPTGSSQGWERTLGTLRNWKNFGQMPSSTRGKGPVAARYEPILDTTPIIVDQMEIHENRLDLIEDGMMEMPGGDAFNELQEQVNNAEGSISAITNELQSLKACFEVSSWSYNNLENAVGKIEGQMDYCQTLAHNAMAQATHLIKPKEYYNKKKEDKGKTPSTSSK